MCVLCHNKKYLRYPHGTYSTILIQTVSGAPDSGWMKSSHGKIGVVGGSVVSENLNGSLCQKFSDMQTLARRLTFIRSNKTVTHKIEVYKSYTSELEMR